MRPRLARALLQDGGFEGGGHRFLEHYARTLTSCEVNATFYRIQSTSALERWAASVPVEFRFAVKAHRRLTYRRQVAVDDGTATFAREFLASLAPLGPKLGCLLIQVPEFVERDDEALAGLLDLLPSELPFACELQHRSWEAPEAVLDLCSARGIAYLPFFPLAAGNVSQQKPALAAIAERHGASPSQIALAWLLQRSPVILPIPGTSSLAHLEENWEARRIALSPQEMEAIGRSKRPWMSIPSSTGPRWTLTI